MKMSVALNKQSLEFRQFRMCGILQHLLRAAMCTYVMNVLCLYRFTFKIRTCSMHTWIDKTTGLVWQLLRTFYRN